MGVVWKFNSIPDVECDVQIDEKSFDMNAGSGQQSAASPGLEPAVQPQAGTTLDAGSDL